MKSVYWRPARRKPTVTLLLGACAALLLFLVEETPRWVPSPQRHTQQAANALATRCRLAIAAKRSALGLPVHHLFDSASTGLLGPAMSPLTSKPASLEAKQCSVHPQFPAVVVDLLQQAGIRRGDTVAVGWTGSFPGLNVALVAALEALDVRAIPIASVTASQYGANEPDLTWLDMEHALREADLTSIHSLAASIGGPADRGEGMGPETSTLARAAMLRNAVPPLLASSRRSSIDARQQIIRSTAGEVPVKAYINVGGGVASCGGRHCSFPSGLSKSEYQESPDCLLRRYSDVGIPVIHLANPRRLAADYQLPEVNQATSAAPLSQHGRLSRILAGAALLALCGVLRWTILSDRGDKLWYAVRRRLTGRAWLRPVGHVDGPQLMV